MRPITLVFQVVVAAMSAAIGRAFAPPRHLARCHQHSSLRLGAAGHRTPNSAAAAAAAAAAAGSQQQHHVLRLSLPVRQVWRGQRALGMVRASSRGLNSLPRDHAGNAGRSQGAHDDGGNGKNLHVAATVGGDQAGDNGSRGPSADIDDVLTRVPDVDQSNDAFNGAFALDDELNESQRDAIFAEVGAVRVVAGPGSGKTRVLTRRIAHLVRNVGAPAWSILAVTFTKKASEEMRARVRKTLGEDMSGQVALGTFHSICARLLRRHGDALPAVVPGLDSRFSIFDTEDSRRLLTDIIKEMGQDIKEVKPNMMRSSISKLKSQGLGPQDIAKRSEDMLERGKSTGFVGGKARHANMVAEIYTKYQARLIQSNALDFDDIILVALRLLRQDEEVFRSVGRQYRHILVDEWQDTNGPQYDIILEIVRAGREAQQAREDNRRAAQAAREGGSRGIDQWGEAEGPAYSSPAGLGDRGSPDTGGAEAETPSAKVVGVRGGGAAGRPRPQPAPPSIFVVGDTDQCIYKFRGADYTNVARFVKDFEGCRTVMLRENYRSTANIARAATAVIGQVSGRAEQPTIATTAVQGDGLPIGVMVCSDAAGEAEAVAHHLELYWTSGRVQPSEMAVMYRTNAQSRSFEEACLRKALPFVVVGAQRFYERREVKDCLVYLRLAANPRDALAMRRAINTPTRGIGAKTEEALEALSRSARKVVPGLTLPECLLSLLEDGQVDELEGVLGAPWDESGAPSFTQEGAFGGGVGTWPGESYDEAFGGDAEENEDGWRGFSVSRVRALKEAFSERGDEIEGPTKAQANKLRVFARLLCRLRVVSATQTVPELLRTVLEETGMHKHVTETLSTTGPAEGEDRWQNVVELERAASNPKFSGNAGDGALVAFLNEVALVGGDDPEQARKQREEEEAAAGGNGGQASPVPGVKPPMIQLMTVHASKGLEFDTVFVAGCEEGTFPMKDTTDDEMDEERRLMYVGMTRAKARLFLTWRKKRMVFGQSWGKRDKTGAQILDADRSRFLDDIPRNIVRTIDKTGGGGVGAGAGAGSRRGAYGGGGGGGGRSQSSQRRNEYSASPAYGGGGGGGGRRGAARGSHGVSEPESDPTMDFMTELSNDISRQATARRSPGGYTSGYSNSGRGGGGRRAGYGEGGGRGRGGGSYASERSGDARAFMEQRNKVESAKYPVPALTDGGRRLARESGEGVDTSWAAKLVKAAPKTPGPPRGVVVGAQVTHPIHGPGEVVALVEGSEGVNVRFVSQGQPFLTRVLGSKLKLVR